MGSRPAPIIDPHLKPHENYSNELNDLNFNLISAGEPAYLTFKVKSALCYTYMCYTLLYVESTK